MSVTLIVVIICLAAFGFAFTNGFHDAGNSIGTSIASRALSPHVALIMAALLNFVGALLGTHVAEMIWSGMIQPPEGFDGLTIVAAGLVGATVWNLITWWFGFPTSSTHALIGGLLGGGIAGATAVNWSSVSSSVIAPMFLAPLTAFILAFLGIKFINYLFRAATYRKTMRGFRYAQSISAASMAIGHGMQDAQKTMGVIMITLVSAGMHESAGIPLWVKVGAAAAMALGTYTGGYRIIRTLAHRITEIDPPSGFAAEVSAAGLYIATSVAGVPISTSHTVAGTIAGVGATRGSRWVRWDTASKICAAWLLTLPGAALIAWVSHYLLMLVR